MASNKITLHTDAVAAFTITMASLASNAARQATFLTNSDDRPGAIIYVKITSGAVAPTAGKVYEIYLLRGDGTIRTDGAGANDAAITIENAPLLGTIVVTNNSAKAFYGEFNTADVGPLGDSWAVAIRNATDQAISTTEGDHRVSYQYYGPDVEAAA